MPPKHKGKAQKVNVKALTKKFRDETVSKVDQLIKEVARMQKALVAFKKDVKRVPRAVTQHANYLDDLCYVINDKYKPWNGPCTDVRKSLRSLRTGATDLQSHYCALGIANGRPGEESE